MPGGGPAAGDHSATKSLSRAKRPSAMSCYQKAFATSREIELDGEAYFEVTHNPEHPFIIKAGELQTKLLGTRFTVKNYKDEELAAVSLINGSIEVTRESEKPTFIKHFMH